MYNNRGQGQYGRYQSYAGRDNQQRGGYAETNNHTSNMNSYRGSRGSGYQDNNADLEDMNEWRQSMDSYQNINNNENRRWDRPIRDVEPRKVNQDNQEFPYYQNRQKSENNENLRSEGHSEATESGSSDEDDSEGEEEEIESTENEEDSQDEDEDERSEGNQSPIKAPRISDYSKKIDSEIEKDKHLVRRASGGNNGDYSSTQSIINNSIASDVVFEMKEIEFDLKKVFKNFDKADPFFKRGALNLKRTLKKGLISKNENEKAGNSSQQKRMAPMTSEKVFNHRNHQMISGKYTKTFEDVERPPARKYMTGQARGYQPPPRRTTDTSGYQKGFGESSMTSRSRNSHISSQSGSRRENYQRFRDNYFYGTRDRTGHNSIKATEQKFMR